MFRVKATYDYSSPHEDDLSFKLGQIITVTEEVDADWCVGEYTDDNGAKHDGMFPRNFVEKYEPEPPPRPNRASRYKPVEQPVAQAPPPQPQVQQEEPEEIAPEEPEPEALKPQAPPVQTVPPVKAEEPPMSPVSPPSATSAKSTELLQVPIEASKPPPAAKKAPPPVAAKSNAFRDRIAAFNAPAAAPIQPFKPSGAPTTFIKKPFVAPPPSRNAYVPPPKEAPQVKAYRRDEDPEIAERQAQDEEAADRAGLVAHDTGNQANEEDDQPKLSLKERIALLQKQQQEQAERLAGSHKEKPKRPPVKKRTESHEAHIEDSEDTGLEKIASSGSRQRESLDQARPPRTSHDMKASELQHNRDLVSENDADQSGAGDTEDAEGTSTSVEDDEDRSKHRQPSLPIRAAAAPTQEEDVGDEQDLDEDEEEEDEMDAETRRKMELRERMAKMSGGMGMGNVFNPMGMAPLPPKKKKPTEKKVEAPEEYSMPQQRVAIFPMSGGGSSVRSPDGDEDRSLAVEKEDDIARPITDTHRAEEVPDVEDIAPQHIQRTPTGERPPPTPSEKRPVPPPIPSASRPVPPPIPNVTSPGPGSESGDELTDAGGHTLSPKSPISTGADHVKRNSYFGAPIDQAHDVTEKRVSSFPHTIPTSPTAGRPPPPPPPTQAPPSRQSDAPQRHDRNEGETDYEGDYDTDIAPGATHKDALKAHTRDASFDGSTVTDEPHSARSPTTPFGLPPLPPSVPRAVPPPPPPQVPNRQSLDAPRAAPPVPPVPPPTRNFEEDDDDEYDPYRYNSPPNLPPPATRAAPPPPPHFQSPPPQNRPPPPMPPSMPPVPQHHAAESSDEDDLYSAPPPRTSHDRPPPPQAPPQAPPHHHAPPPPPPQERAAPLPPMSEAQPRSSMAPRKSLDAARTLGGRTSMEQSRPVNQGFIASDIDLGTSSHWWTQPKLLPPSLQNRKDVLVTRSDAQSGNTVEKSISVLYMDYSQTAISARFEANNVSDVNFNQEHIPPPPAQRPDQLEQAYEQFGRQIAKAAESKQNTVVGNGTPHGLIDELLKPYPNALPPVSTRAFGALVYANLANASTQSYDEIRPGDIISFRNARFQGKTGPMHAKYSVDVGKPDHVGVVLEWDGSKKKVRVWEQGREHKKVKPESFKMGDLRSGEVRVWRVMSRSWVGWD